MNTTPLSIIQSLYPELQHGQNDPTITGLAYYDWGCQLAFIGFYTLFGGYSAFIRCGEMYEYSLTKVDPDQNLVRAYFEKAALNFQMAQDCFDTLPVEVAYCTHVANLLTCGQPEKRWQVWQDLQSLHNTHKKNAPQSNHTVFLNTNMALLSRFNLDIDPIEQLLANRSFRSLAFPVMMDVAPLNQIVISAEERSQAFSKRLVLLEKWRCPLKPSPAHTVNYTGVTWRTSLVQLLWQAEHPQIPFEELNIGIFGASDSLFEHELRQRGIPVQVGLESYDMCTLWHLADFSESDLLQQAFNLLKPNGLLIAAAPRSRVNPEQVRHQIETLTQSTCYLVDREGFTDVLVIYLFKGQYFIPHLHVLILMRPDSIQSFGGADIQMMNSRATFKQWGIRSDISLALRLEPDHYDVVYVVGYLHEHYQFQVLKACSKPILCMPIVTAFQNECDRGDALYRPLLSLLVDTPPASVLHVIETYLATWQQNSTQMAPAKRFWNPYLKRYYEPVAQYCDYFVPQGSVEMAILCADTQQTPLPFQLIYNGCHAPLRQTATAEIFVQTYGLQDFILCIGRIEKNKNQLMFCYALRETGLPIVLVGKNGSDPTFAQLCQTVNPQVLHIEHLSDTMLASALKAARLFVLPSASEVSPLVTIEAAWAGCPVVLTKNSIQDEQFGDAFYYCDPFDPAHMRQVVLAAYDADNTGRIAKAKAIVEQYCTWEKMAQQLAEVCYMLYYQSQGRSCVRLDEQWYVAAPSLEPDDLQLPLIYHPDLGVSLVQQAHTISAERYVGKAVFEVYSDFAGIQLQHLGLKTKKIPHHYLGLFVDYQPKPLDLPDRKAFNGLCLYHPQNYTGWQAALTAFLRVFHADSDAILFMYAHPESISDTLHEELESAITAGGFDLENIPEISILTEAFTAEELLRLFYTVDVILLPYQQVWGQEGLFYLAELSGQPFVVPQLNQEISPHQRVTVSWEQLQQVSLHENLQLQTSEVTVCLQQLFEHE